MTKVNDTSDVTKLFLFSFLISKNTSSELVLFIAVQTKPDRNSDHGVSDLCRNL